MLKSVTMISAAALAAAVLSGCVITGTTYVRERRPPPDRVVIVDRPGPDYVIVRRSPPPIRVERIPPRPGSDVIWVPGFWHPRGNEWEWRDGHYERPPRREAVWVEPRYNRRGSTEVEFQMGFWR